MGRNGSLLIQPQGTKQIVLKPPASFAIQRQSNYKSSTKHKLTKYLSCHTTLLIINRGYKSINTVLSFWDLHCMSYRIRNVQKNQTTTIYKKHLRSNIIGNKFPNFNSSSSLTIFHPTSFQH
ncbi:hypothetical protein EGW08_014895 [Elysia chlorotica]|uniref:Uncharacterized protein n=1 Tax=Elysia chlorotica TaxID=188477 RepID=A0A3S0ZEX3_ELYCH|nr:hypothetical protein EGW08_014895 [Elysia chlorotica]